MSQWGSFKGQLEKSVIKLAQKVEQIYNNQCSQQNANCNVKSYNQCQGIDTRECIEYPQRQGCPWSGASVSKSGGIRFPQTVDRTSLQNNQKLLVCASYKADQVLKQIKVKFNTKINRAYFGTYFGYFRAYPATQQDLTVNNTICVNSFDPRIRPWYIGAATGIKNVVIVINNSMAQRNLAQTKRMAKAIIDTLGPDDFISIITYPVSTELLGTNVKVIQVKNINKTTIKSNIDSLTIQTGLNNYQSAFIKVKQMLTEQKSKSICQPPNNLVFFMADSAPNDGLLTVKELIDSINLWNNDQNYKMKLFTYGIGPNVDKTLLKDLSCNLHGQSFSLADSTTSSDMISYLPRFYSYQSARSVPDQPLWSDPFTDASTGDRIVGVSMPIYYYQNSQRQVLGVANIAVRVATLTQQYGFASEKQIIDSLVRYRCIGSSSTVIVQSDYQIFRVNKCSSSSYVVSSCGYTALADGIGDPPLKGEKQRYQCCSFTTGSFVGLILGIFFGIALIIAAFCLYRYYKNRGNVDEQIQDVGKMSQPAQQSATGLNPLSITSPPKLRSAPSQHPAGQKPKNHQKINYQVATIDCSKST